MRFEAPLAFLLLSILPILLLLLRRKRSAAILFSSQTLTSGLVPSLRQRMAWLPLALRIAVLALLTLGIARPQYGSERIRDSSKGVAIEMVVDRSSSMSAEMEYDGQRLTRLDVVKRVFEEFVSGGLSDGVGRTNDLIGMITFARYPETVCPLTLAHGALQELLRSVKIVQQKLEDGTNVGDAIALAAARLKTAEDTMAKQVGEEVDYEIKSKVIILLTDGQSNVGKRGPIQAAELAKKWGIKIYTIGVGGSRGLMRQKGFFGSFLVPMGPGVDQQTLSSIAEVTGGVFRMADDADSLRTIYKEINELEQSEIKSIRFLDYKEYFQSFAYLALALLLLEVVLSLSWFRRLP